jgi:16S rRNA A1518/A1519 N6-dimethyltransferase RsmA/KsgA/DIM1 with predicted DNA glycosylase/AP lyase activity
VLEIGPGFGATTRLLAPRVDRLSVLELSDSYCTRLRAELGDTVDVTHDDATRRGRRGCGSPPLRHSSAQR